MRIVTDSRNIPDLTKVVSKDVSRPVLTAAHLDVERKVIEATDSYRLAVIPVEVEDGDVSGTIPGEALAAFTKAHRRNAPTPSLLCAADGFTLTANGTTQSWPRVDLGKFPNVPQLIPEEGSRSAFKIGLSAALLADLAKGLGSDNGHVVLSFVVNRDKTEDAEQGCYSPASLRPILVSTPSNPDAVGLLMPVRI